MNMYEITYRHKGEEVEYTRKIVGWSAEEAADWLRDTLWTMSNGHEEIQVVKTEEAC